ncbi:MAG: nickel-dependent lactate racemase [Lachnospiraceae bacterium]|jgi:nickel-dependent lactate racemase|nr:nickel-dependent lactate racemase [Lachnospiraceae bacterium]MCI1657956.1 nickel-dependent lactate racemase [Lachnospiraceae bacterium]
MKTVKFFYGKTTYDLEVPDDTPVLTSKVDQLKSDKNGLEIVREAMMNPIDSPRLCELAKGKPDCVIIISDHTRPVPSKDILPVMIEELRKGSPDIKITLLVSTGFHRPTTVEELKNKLGDELYNEFKDDIIVHDAHNPETNTKIGVLPSGPDCIVDKVAVNASLLVAEGFIEAHFFAGFSGGRKSILPGVADAVTVMGNHCSKFIDSPYARTGILDKNPIHEDMVAAARMANLAFICNVVIDEDKKTVAAFAGNFETAHRKGCDFISDYIAVKPAPADIVITTNGGYPLDQNAYQSPKGMTAGEATVKEDGVIIMLASCIDGTGGDFFYHIIADEPTIEDAYQKFLATEQNDTAPDQWCSQILARIVRKHKVIFVAEPEQKEMIEGLKMTYAPDLDTAYRMAREIKGEDASLTCIPNGISVVVRD